MDRQIVYPGQILPETSLLQMTKDAMIGTAKLASALLGTSTYASGFAVTPTGPASLQVLYAPGEIYSLSTIDAVAFSTLPADTTHSILKQGILLDGGTLNCPAPGTTGQSINYLIQATYQDSDAAPVLLPYYNSANPALPYSGIGNNGLTQNTIRKGIAVVSAKAGASATTGSQVTPAPDVGYIGLYVVTVSFGQTTIAAGNISLAASAPLINSTLHGLSPTFTVSPVIPAATLPAHAMQLGQAVGRLIGVQAFTITGGTYTPTPGTTSVIVEVQGGGGGGGGAGATSAGVVSVGAGGGSGGYAKSRLTSGFAGVAVVVGAAGGGGASVSAGANGAASSFGAVITAGGGGGGTAMAPTATYPVQAVGGNQGASSGGNIVSSAGSCGGSSVATSAGNGISGSGGNSVMSGGAARAIGSGQGTSALFGAGGSGAISQSTATAYGGGAGGSGAVIVWEYS